MFTNESKTTFFFQSGGGGGGGGGGSGSGGGEGNPKLGKKKHGNRPSRLSYRTARRRNYLVTPARFTSNLRATPQPPVETKLGKQKKN